MSGSDIQGQVLLNSSPAVAAVDQVGNAMDRLATKTRRANKEAVDLQSRVERDFKRTGQAASKAGGPLGSIGGRVLGGLGMGGPLGVAAVGLAALTTSATALTAASDRAVESARKAVEEENKLHDAREKGQRAMQTQAVAGAQQAPTVRRLVAMLGYSGEDHLGRLEESGISTSSAASGLEALVRRFPNQALTGDTAPANAIEQAKRLQLLGMDFSEAIERLIQHGGLGTQAGAERSAALVFKQFSGLRGNALESYQNGLARVGSSKSLADEQRFRELEGAIPGIQRRRSGELAGVAAQDLAEARSPVSKALNDLSQINQKQLDQLTKMAEAESAIARWLKTSARTFGLGQGSARQQLGDQVEANATAIFAPER